MSDCSMFETALQLGGVCVQAVDIRTGEVLPPGDTAGWDRVSGGVPAGSIRGACSNGHILTGGVIRGYCGGSLLEAEKPKTKGEQKGGGIRGIIKEFTRKSRRNFMYLMAKVQKAKLPLFATLTYPDEFDLDMDQARKHVERFRRRLERRGWGSIWRREWVARKSGKHVGVFYPHYHLLVWGVDLITFRKWVARAWWESCGRLSDAHLQAGTNVKTLNDWGGVTYYVSKYMAKVEVMPDGVTSLGRFWGVINGDAIPWAEIEEIAVSSPVVQTFFRYMRRYAGLKARSGQRSARIFCNDPSQWLRASMKC